MILESSAMKPRTALLKKSGEMGRLGHCRCNPGRLCPFGGGGGARFRAVVCMARREPEQRRRRPIRQTGRVQSTELAQSAGRRSICDGRGRDCVDVRRRTICWLDLPGPGHLRTVVVERTRLETAQRDLSVAAGVGVLRLMARHRGWNGRFWGRRQLQHHIFGLWVHPPHSVITCGMFSTSSDNTDFD